MAINEREILSFIEELYAVKRVCDLYGYGNVMEWASALWRHEARLKGYPITGCFVPTCPEFIREGFGFDHAHIIYDEIVSTILTTKEDASCRQ